MKSMIAAALLMIVSSAAHASCLQDIAVSVRSVAAMNGVNYTAKMRVAFGEPSSKLAQALKVDLSGENEPVGFLIGDEKTAQLSDAGTIEAVKNASGIALVKHSGENCEVVSIEFLK